MLKRVVERLMSASALVVAVALAVVAPAPLVAALVGVPAAVAFATGARWKLDRSAEAMLTFAALAVGAVLPRLFAVDTTNMPQYLSDRGLFFVCPLLLLGGARAALREPAFGARGTLALLLVALAGAGRAKSGAAFPMLVAMFLVLAAVTLAATDPSRALPKGGRARHVAALAAGSLLSVVVALSIALPLPGIHARLVDRIMSRLGARSGFGDSLTLGELHGMLMSDRVVARVRNGAPEYLRGAVYGSYAAGGWNAVAEDAPIYRPGDEAPQDRSRYVEIELVRRPERYFLPKEATDIWVSSGAFFENREGIRWPASTVHWAKRVWYQPGESRSLAGPSNVDRAVPQPLRSKLQAILDEWGVTKAESEAARVGIIQRELEARYDYSLDYERSPGADFVLDFLTTHKKGHCEYFASAFVLLARQAKVPARVVAGFRVSERSPLSDYAVVRERNAHSWAEVWLDDRWTTWDPTPPSAFPPGATKTPVLSAAWDLASTSWEKVDDFLSARSPFELTLALVVLVGLLILVRSVRGRRGATSPSGAAVDPPLPAFAALERALDRAGLGRAPHETLDAFARRLEGEERREIAPSVAAIRAYAAHRYGGKGARADVERALDAAASAFV